MTNKYLVGKTLSGSIILFDYEIMRNTPTEFIYVALNDIDAFGIKKKFLLNGLLHKYPEIESGLRISAFMNYVLCIRKPMMMF